MNLDQFQKDNKYLMLALNHRGSFKKLMNSGSPDAVTNEEASKLKKEIIESLADQFSGLLIDVDYCLPAYKGKDKPFLLPLEKSGYTEDLRERVTQLERSAEELKNLGASGAKLLLCFNPNLVSATQQIETAKKALFSAGHSHARFKRACRDCCQGDIISLESRWKLRSPFFLKRF